MKKLLFCLLTLLALSSVVYADELATAERFATIPNIVPIETSTFSDELSLDQKLYNRIVEGFQNKTDIINILDLEIPYSEDIWDAVFDIYCTAVYNNPQYGDLRTVASCQYQARKDENGNIIAIGNIVNIIPCRLAEYDEEAYHQEINYALSKVFSPDMSDTDKLLSIHNYLCEKITYSTYKYEQVDVYGNTVIDFDPSVYTSYGALVNDDCVCQGYALAFKLLCNYVGIDCGYAVADEYMNENGKTVAGHIWNVVACNGNYYHIDATWDDSINIVHSVTVDDKKEEKICSSEHIARVFSFLTDEESDTMHGYPSWNKTISVQCNEDTLRESLFGGNLTSITYPMVWQDGDFWFENPNIQYDAETDSAYHTSVETYCKVSDSGVWAVSSENYLPNKRLEAKMYTPIIVDGVPLVAIDGTPNTTAKLYATSFDENGKFLGVEIVDVVFDSVGETTVEIPIDTSKLMLFENDTIRPIAYAK